MKVVSHLPVGFPCQCPYTGSRSSDEPLCRPHCIPVHQTECVLGCEEKLVWRRGRVPEGGPGPGYPFHTRQSGSLTKKGEGFEGLRR